MQIPENAIVLRILLGEDDRHEGAPLHEAIVLAAREHHLAGATIPTSPTGGGCGGRSLSASVA